MSPAMSLGGPVHSCKEETTMKRIITIGREFGAGGGELGRRLAREMNIAYYDRDIILKTAKPSAFKIIFTTSKLLFSLCPPTL